MTDRNKFEEMLERLINEDREGAEELFHEIVVEKSRDIYEGLLESDLEDIEEAEETDEEVDEAADEEVDESDDDEEVEEGFDLDEFEVEADDDMGGDPADDMMGDIEADMDDMDDEGGEDMGDDELEDRVMDIEDALDDLKAEFEKMMDGDMDDEGDDAEDDMDDDMDDEDEAEKEEFAFEGANKDAMMKDAEKMSKAEFIKKHGKENADTYDNMNETTKSAGETMREYVEKVTATMGDNGANTKSAVASANDMGGEAGNIAQGADEKGGSAESAKEDSHGNVNVPGGKASKSMKAMPKGHGAEKKGAGETADNKKSVVGK